MIWLVGIALFWAGLLAAAGEILWARLFMGMMPVAWGVVLRLALPAGLMFAWVLTRWLSLRAQVILQLVLMSTHFVLSGAVGLDFFAIEHLHGWQLLLVASRVIHPAILSVLLPTWLSRTQRFGHRHAFAISACFFVGLTAGVSAYPLLIDAILPLHYQNLVWNGEFIVLLAMTAGAGLMAISGFVPEKNRGTADCEAFPTWGQRLSWFLLAALAGPLPGLLTAIITTDLSPVPLLWLVPTALALLAPATALLSSAWNKPAIKMQLTLAGGYCGYAFLFFAVLYFQLLPGAPWLFFVLPCVVFLALPQALTWPGQICWTAAMFWLYFASSPLAQERLIVFIGVLCLGLYATCRGCYGDAVALRPSARHLPEFFLWLSLGQTLGSFLGQWVPPLIFDSMVEVPLLVGAALVGRLMLTMLNWLAQGKTFNLRDLERT